VGGEDQRHAAAGRLTVEPDGTRRAGAAVAPDLGSGPPKLVAQESDRSSDVHVMLHVNNRNGFTVAVSETTRVTRIARRTVLGDSALGVLVPILEDVLGWDADRIRRLFESYGRVLQEWDKARTDWVTVGD
jgi:hypothetical protein